MKRYRGYLALLAALVVALLTLLMSRASRSATTPNKLAVIFIGMTNNPVRTMGPPRVEVSGVEGSLWMPGYSCLMAVGWPPGLSTNAFWRLRVGYGRDPSDLETLINQRVAQPLLGRELFRSSKEENSVSSSEVVR
jgi:hypothetical protein